MLTSVNYFVKCLGKILLTSKVEQLCRGERNRTLAQIREEIEKVGTL